MGGKQRSDASLSWLQMRACVFSNPLKSEVRLQSSVKNLWKIFGHNWLCNINCTKRKGVLEHAQNAQIQVFPAHAQSFIRTFALH